MDYFEQALDELRRKGLYRNPRTVESPQGPTVRIRGREVLCLCSNNYMGLAADPEIAQAASESLLAYGAGAGASRLISGSMPPHHRLEETAAEFMEAEAALLFGSGYLANLGAMDALASEGDILYSDSLNHASLIDGCRLSRAESVVFPHKDYDFLYDRMKEAPDGARKIVVSDSVFSMDGDLADIPILVDLKEELGATLYIDEAHAIGLLGQRGAGAVERFGCADKVDFRMATLGKSVGTYGAFIAGSRVGIDFLANRCRTYIFTTAPPPMLADAAVKALEMVERQSARRDTLLKNVRGFSQRLQAQGWRLASQPEAAIVPILIGEAQPTMEMAESLLEEGVLATGIRPPTVPEGTCRIRCTLMATHTDEQIETALGAIQRCGQRLGLI